MKKLAFVFLAACHHASVTADDASAAAPTITVATVTATTATATATALVPSGKTYAIRMKRPGRVGASAHLAVDDEHEEHTTTRALGETKETRKSTHAHIEGTSRLLALQPDGQSALRDEMIIADFWSEKDGAKEKLATAGARLVVERAAKKADARVTLDGHPVTTKALIDALDQLTTLTLHKGPSDDDVFGTKVPQPVGGEWPIDGALAEKDLRDRDMGIPPGSVTGSTKLVAVRAIRGVDCLELDNHITVGALQSIGELPAGSTIKNGRVDVHMHLMLPVDETKAALESQMDLVIAGSFTVPTPRGPVEVELDSVDHKQAMTLP